MLIHHLFKNSSDEKMMKCSNIMEDVSLFLFSCLLLFMTDEVEFRTNPIDHLPVSPFDSIFTARQSQTFYK